MMTIAFNNFKEIDSKQDLEEKQKAWMKDYSGIRYSIAYNKKHSIKWMSEPVYYDENKFASHINCIGRKKDRLIIEFDEVKGEPNNPKESLEKVKVFLENLGVGYIQSTHGSLKSDYIWVEFTRDLSEKEAKNFLAWVCPKGANIDLNFASDKKVFPVLFADHWKYPQRKEIPVKFFIGNKIDYDKLDIPEQKIKEITKIGIDGFAYKTYKAMSMFGNKVRAKEIVKAQPIFYDKAGLFWLWNPNKYYWEIVDEVSILNMVESATGQDVITPTNRNYIINALKQLGRRNIPKDVKPTWVQFKDTIVDVERGEQFKATPEYFVTNPIDWELEKDVFDMPNMDRIFAEWVGDDNVELLYEIIAYCLIPDYPINRIFCFIGSGLNGKSAFLNLLIKFIGKRNCTSTELDVLLSSRFEVTRLHKKLVCLMGETNFNELSKTSMLKKLTGNDLINYEYKNKTPFEEKNYAKILIATNNLPTTTDKTDGFFRRWAIIDFPNKFNEKKNILDEIPDKEYNSLALRCVYILRSLLKKREFTNEGSIEQRKEKYESKSDFLKKFKDLSTIEDYNSYITKSEFYKRFSKWSKENNHREMSDISVGMQMKKLGVESDKKYFQWLFDGKGGQARVWLGIKWRD